MPRSMIRLVLACLAGALVGFFAGTVVGIACASGPCSAFNPGFQLSGAVLGAGAAAWAVLAVRPDPRACNRQDPPMPPEG